MLAAVTVVAEVVRSGLVESVHHGAVIGIDSFGASAPADSPLTMRPSRR